MTDSSNNTTASPAKAPAFIAYHVRDREGSKGVFTRIGAAWPHKDGKGFSIQIDAVPLDGRVTLRIASDQKD
jgi:hypothetical protein